MLDTEYNKEYKRCKVVMLKSDKSFNNWYNIFLHDFTNQLEILSNLNVINRNGSIQDLYVISQDKILEHNCYIHIANDISGREYMNLYECHKPHRYLEEHDNYFVDGFFAKNCWKVIATTNSRLHSCHNADNDPEKLSTRTDIVTMDGIPKIPNTFINTFCDEYNKSNSISEVMVEAENSHYIKLYADNTVAIKQIKTSWNREEVHNLLMQAWIYGEATPNAHYSVRENWIMNNLF